MTGDRGTALEGTEAEHETWDLKWNQTLPRRRGPKLRSEHGEPRVKQLQLMNLERTLTEKSTTTAQAREFAENLRAPIHTNAPLPHLGKRSSW